MTRSYVTITHPGALSRAAAHMSLICPVRPANAWLPEDQDDLELWLAGHRERAEARGGQVVLHPVLTEFQGLIDTDPVVRMYVNQMIAQVPGAKPYRMIDSKVTPGYHVGKGEELGYFQYGGSTHCLVFRPGAIAEFALAAIPSRTTPRRRG